ncbi:hypothetical protein [Paracoccus homiensis]|uniref:Uncharacterized protein n=1 Tax=Paracoccus homiensis TaxID=364199 RepID=A0A1I0GVS6_9RHOB|nr:hypothetical protein [Paracoccus homiensis]SET75330.1 hypothetical protein SAMN04489858_109109 [Paracoccus homiensis]
MPAYTVANATPAPQTLPTPGADAWVMPLGGTIRIAESDGDLALAMPIASGVPFPVTNGASGLRYVSDGSASVIVRMQDKL